MYERLSRPCHSSPPSPRAAGLSAGEGRASPPLADADELRDSSESVPPAADASDASDASDDWERHNAEVYWSTLPQPSEVRRGRVNDRFRFDLRRTLSQLRTAFSTSAR